MDQIATQIIEWMGNKLNNAIMPGSDLPAFGEPLVGYASGDDPLFAFFKEDIGSDFYWTPLEAFKAAYPDIRPLSNKLSVIAWVLPQTEHTRDANKQATNLPSKEWSCARHYGEQVNENLRRYVVDLFVKQGIEACAPILLSKWSRALSDRYGFASCWSERHAAHACGLGTFGLSDGLITPLGKAIRIGSVIIHKQIPPTPRAYSKYNQWCLFNAKGKCQACIKRCPADAISEKGHDKVKCKNYIRNVTALHVEREQLGFRVNSCGLCQTKVPCENKNPTILKKDL